VGGLPNATWNDAKVTVWDATVPAGAVGTIDRVQYLWRADRAHGNMVRVAFSPDGRHLASVGRDSVAHVWAAVDGQEVRNLGGQMNGIYAAAWTPNSLELWLALPTADGYRMVSHAGGALTTRFLTVLYPRYPDQAMPTVTALAGGKGLRLEHQRGVDLVFMSEEPFTYEAQGTKFVGRVGAVRYMEGETWMTLVEGTSFTWQGRTLTKAGTLTLE